MPTYGYECKSCKYSFDYFQNIKDEPLKICPKCGKELRRLINGGTGVIFKGGGFYATDKNSKSSKADSGKPASGEGASCADCPKSETCPKEAS